MKQLSSKLALLGVLLASMLVIGCQGGSGGAEAVDDSPEAVAFRYRQGLMRTIAWKVVGMRAMVDGDAPQDEAAFTKSANDLVTLAGMIPEGFIPNSGDIDGSAAQPDIWTNWSDFEMKASEFQAGVQGLADAANTGGYAAAQGLVREVQQSCGGCHRPYRRRDEE